MLFRFAARAITAMSLILLTNCVTPMAPSEIDALTTCSKGTDIAKVKKNLLLAGYGIEHVTDEELITDYKQAHGRAWQRITALKMDDVVKFKVRVRKESYESVPGGSTTSVTSFSSGGKKSKKEERQVVTENRQERVTNDMDESYYVEYRPNYEKTKVEVCGSI